MTTAIALVTEEEFAARYGPDDRVELVDGEVVPGFALSVAELLAGVAAEEPVRRVPRRSRPR